MKISNILKVLGITAAVAALTPYEVKKDEETGATTVKALLWGAKYTPAGDAGRNVDVTLGLHVPGRNDEADLFADDEPEAAVLDGTELQDIADEAQEADDEAQAIADEAQETADELQAIADKAQEDADAARHDSAF